MRRVPGLERFYFFVIAAMFLLIWPLFRTSPTCALEAGSGVGPDVRLEAGAEIGLEAVPAIGHGAGPGAVPDAAPKGKDYNLLLITVDTLRADHVGCYGYRQIKTPTLDALAAQGVIFTKAITPAPLTLPAHSSIMTGQYPIQHGVRNNGNFVLGKGAHTLAEIMRENGYRTGACVGAFVLDSIFGLNQGFDFYEDRFPARGKPMEVLYNDRKAGEVTHIGLNWLEKNRGKKFFLWLHYFDPHATYSPPAPFAEEYQKCPYDGEIAYTDQCIGDLFKGLERLGLSKRTIIILTADHGESLGEHGEATHAIFIYDATLRVPLIIKGPEGVFPKGKSIPALVSNMDILPTVLDLFGFNPITADDRAASSTGDDGATLSTGADEADPSTEAHRATPSTGADEAAPSTDAHKATPSTGADEALPSIHDLAGKSLLPLILDKTKEIRQELLCESLSPELDFGWSRLEGVRGADWKYIQAPHPEFYLLAEDPGEKKNLIQIEKDTKGWLQGKSDLERLKKAWLPILPVRGAAPARDALPARGPGACEPANQAEMAGDVRERLRSLGYVKTRPKNSQVKEGQYPNASNTPNASNPPHSLTPPNTPNPPNPLKAPDPPTTPNDLKDPKEMIYLINYLDQGISYLSAHLDDQAMLCFLKILQVNPDNTAAHTNLGRVYQEKKLLDQAEAELKKAVSLDPEQVDAHNQLGLIYYQKGNFDLALEEFKLALAWTGYPEIHHNLSLAYDKTGRKDEAMTAIDEALRLDPNYVDAHNQAGNLFLNRGDLAKAAAHFEAAIRIDPRNSSAYNNLGLIYSSQGKTELAVQYCRQAVFLDPNSPDAHNNLGSIYLNQSLFQEGMVELKKAIALRPDYKNALINLGMAYFGLKDYAMAEREYRQAIELDRDYADGYTQIGLLYLEKSDFSQALSSFQEVLRLHPADALAYYSLGKAQRGLGQIDQAILSWEKSLSLRADLPGAHLNLGNAYFEKNLVDKAMEEWKAALAGKGIDLSTHLLNVGQAYSQMGQNDKAIAAWQKAADLDPENPAPHYQLGVVYFRQGLYRSAYDEATESVRLQPDNQQSRSLLQSIGEMEGGR